MWVTVPTSGHRRCGGRENLGRPPGSDSVSGPGDDASDMYVSPAVRSIRRDPIEGATVTLLLEASVEADVDALAEAVADLGTVEDELEFDTLAVTVPHERVDEVCDLDGVATVETANTLGIDADGAGEDVRPGE